MIEDYSEFTASFPDIQGAITFHGSGGMRIQLEIAEDQIGEAAKLLMWRELPLQVTIKPLDKGITLSDINLTGLVGENEV